MKKLFLFIIACWSITLQAQTSIAVATDQTVSLIFPFTVSHVDRGAPELLVQLVKEQDNILLVKAATPQLAPTNLSVITSDGAVYSFAVHYTTKPNVWLYKIPAQTHANIATYANGIIDNRLTLHGVRNKRWNMEAKIIGIYIRDNIIYYQLKLDNQGTIDYDISFLRFYIRDKKKNRRTAVQENEQVPLYIAGNTKQVKAYHQSVIVVALEKFTIPDAKYLAVQIQEHNGGRHLLLKVKNNNIMKAIPLPDLK
jgi:conjugative transposon TraN protein